MLKQNKTPDIVLQSTDIVTNIQEEFKQNTTTTLEMTENSSPFSPVFIIQEIDTILDFINSCDEETKEKVLEALKSKAADKALFMTSKHNEIFNYIVLINIANVEVDSLLLAHSESLESLGLFLQEFTDLTASEIKSQYNSNGL